MTIYCPSCGTEQKTDGKFCAKCGQSLTTASKPKTTKKNYGIFGSFNISEEELRSQVENHDTLPISKSSRGVAVLTITGLLIFGSLVSVFLGATGTAGISFSDIVLGWIIYVPLLYFVYKGHLWAVIVLGLWYTADKFYTVFLLSPEHFNMGTVIFWLIGIAPLWAAFRVEREYRRKKMLAAVS